MWEITALREKRPWFAMTPIMIIYEISYLRMQILVSEIVLIKFQKINVKIKYFFIAIVEEGSANMS